MIKRFFINLLHRRLVITLLIIVQCVFIFNLVTATSKHFIWFSGLISIVSVLMSLYIISSDSKPAYKLVWVFILLAFPVFSVVFYFIAKTQTSSKKLYNKIRKIEEETKHLYSLPNHDFKNIFEATNEHQNKFTYLDTFGGFPAYFNTKAKYLSPGEKKLEYLLEALKSAEKYIFLEYFIIEQGKMWGQILEVLELKAKEGLDVRVMYDDVGSFFLLPKNYPSTLEAKGIKCHVFNPFRPFLSTTQNNRDHRKITVIDGKIAFTGGINLADEYINAINKHGHWKDCAVMLEGSGAWSITLMFLQMWGICTGVSEDFAKFYPFSGETTEYKSSGVVQPFSDSPIDNEFVSENIYTMIINNAKEYVYINSPYLIIDDTMLSALKLAAKSGVDVRIVTPHHYDKLLVHITTRSYYNELIEAGVKIYEYTNGFIHSKTFVSDGTIAVCGTINLDYRSLYLHFECGVLMYNTEAVSEIYDDYVDTLKICEEITEVKSNIWLKCLQVLLRLLAPLM